jgi:hypothetical protein
MKTTHTHRGTCQTCGAVQAVDNKSGLIAKHGYKVIYGSFQYVCDAAGLKPAEHDLTHTYDTIAHCLNTADWHDAQIPKLQSGEVVPETFERWNKDKVITKRRRGGGTYESKGGYDTLPIAQATPSEREYRILGQIRHHETNRDGLRGHATFLRRDVVPRFGQPLYPNEELTKTALVVGFKFMSEGTEYVLDRPAFSTWGNRQIGWYVVRVGADPKKQALRWTSKEIRNAMNPKPVVAEGGYTTKKARKDDLDKLNRVFDKKREALNQMYLDLPRDQRTEAKTAIYYGPMQLSHWRSKHSAAVVKEFPAATPLVQDIEALVAERLRIKAAPGA